MDLDTFPFPARPLQWRLLLHHSFRSFINAVLMHSFHVYWHNIIIRHAIVLQENMWQHTQLHVVRNNVSHLIRVSCWISCWISLEWKSIISVRRTKTWKLILYYKSAPGNLIPESLRLAHRRGDDKKKKNKRNVPNGHGQSAESGLSFLCTIVYAMP